MTVPLPTWLSRALNLVGILIVGASIWWQPPTPPPWLIAVVAVALLGWGALAVVRERAPFPLFAVTVVASAVATVPTQGIVVVPAIVAILVAVGSPTRPPWQGVAVVLLAMGFLPLGLLLASMHPLALASIEAGLAVAAFGGFSRRQARRATARERELLEQRARGAALAERQAVARDIHDVLAHSLGGLVIQLDAIDAQLEAGRVDAAGVRVRQARELAASGLAEARRAVDALRDDRVGLSCVAELESTLGELVAAHRALGGDVEFRVLGRARDLPAEQADAVTRALQESFTNARKHAPGEPVAVVVDWTDGVALEVSNPLRHDESAGMPHSGGHGLLGMGERFARFGSVQATERDGRFVVTARVHS